MAGGGGAHPAGDPVRRAALALAALAAGTAAAEGPVRYLFMYKVGPEGSRGGPEHAYGTAMGIPRTALETTEAVLDRLGLPAHELVHAWNVKRVRPRQLQPYRYSRVQRTELLWVAEGRTSYNVSRPTAPTPPAGSGRWRQ